MDWVIMDTSGRIEESILSNFCSLSMFGLNDHGCSIETQGLSARNGPVGSLIHRYTHRVN